MKIELISKKEIGNILAKIAKDGKAIMIEKNGEIIIKKLEKTKEEFEQKLKEAHEFAKKHRITKKDLEITLKKIRKC